MNFTNTDKSLMLRAVRHLTYEAACLLDSEGPNWAATAQSRSAKRVYDRLMRDCRDLRALVKRLEKGAAEVQALKAFVEKRETERLGQDAGGGLGEPAHG